MRLSPAPPPPVGAKAPGKIIEGLAERLSTMTGLSASTAYRRAITLLSWREQVWTPPPPEGIDPAQMSLF